ncbi:MAG: hypothetical protein ACLSHN_10990 [Eubacterium sp.]
MSYADYIQAQNLAKRLPVKLMEGKSPTLEVLMIFFILLKIIVKFQ